MSDKLEKYLDEICAHIKSTQSLKDNVRDEIRMHLEDNIDELVKNGYSKETAMETAIKEFGDVRSLAEYIQEESPYKDIRLIIKNIFHRAGVSIMMEHRVSKKRLFISIILLIGLWITLKLLK